jgi:hypothetical protein
MEYNIAFDNAQNKLLDDQAMGPGLYQMAESLKTNKPAYPWSPGSSTSREGQAPAADLVDIQSDLNNLDRPLTKNVFGEYSPFTAKAFQEPIYGKGDYFDQVNSRLSDPAFDLKEYGVNRWQWLPIDPQKNAVEPFRRIGENTVLETLDAHQTLCKDDSTLP